VYGQEAKIGYFQEKFDLDAIGGAEVAHASNKAREVDTSLNNKVIHYTRTYKK
jgi:hypothetical protein